MRNSYKEIDLIELEDLYENLKSKGFSLDLTRGKPHEDQLDLSRSLNDPLDSFLYQGKDVRNYGELLGLSGCREIGSQLLDFPTDNVVAGNNSSLLLMHQLLSFFYIDGAEETPWNKKDRVSFLCPSPGYDRHFRLCEEFSINMIPVSLTGIGPDIGSIKKVLEKDESIEGIWCVPRHSNPTGDIYSDEITLQLLDLAKKHNFKIFWDNAYSAHDFEESPNTPNIFQLSKNIQAEDHVIAFASTSKITYAGGGVGFVGMSSRNLDRFRPFYASTIISPDKVNQLRHINFFEKINLKTHMASHANLIRPKFDLVEKVLSLQPYGEWTKPSGGYFVSYSSAPGLAKEIVNLAKEAGLKLTSAGATYPYGIDSEDSNIRIAPTACNMEELESALEILVVCICLANLRKNK